MNTGHDGSMTTVHANTARDAMGRLEQMVSMISLARQYEMQTRMLSTAQEMDRSAGQLVAKG